MGPVLRQSPCFSMILCPLNLCHWIVFPLDEDQSLKLLPAATHRQTCAPSFPECWSLLDTFKESDPESVRLFRSGLFFLSSLFLFFCFLRWKLAFLSELLECIPNVLCSKLGDRKTHSWILAFSSLLPQAPMPCTSSQGT